MYLHSRLCSCSCFFSYFSSYWIDVHHHDTCHDRTNKIGPCSSDSDCPDSSYCTTKKVCTEYARVGDYCNSKSCGLGDGGSCVCLECDSAADAGSFQMLFWDLWAVIVDTYAQCQNGYYSQLYG